MIRYYYTMMRLFLLTARVTRLQKKLNESRSNLTTLQTIISTGFTTEKEFSDFNKRLIANRKRELTPDETKALEELRNRHYNQWKPKKHFKDSKNRHAMHEGQQRAEFTRVLRNRPIQQNPDDLVQPKQEKNEPSVPKEGN